jgi:hypothetical protein
MRVVVDSLDDIPEALRSEYEERDGRHVLKLEGEVPGMVKASEHADIKRKLAEFRDKNLKLLSKASELAGVETIDEDLSPLGAAIKSFKDKIGVLENSTSDDKNKFQDMLSKALTPIKEKLEKAELERTEAQERANKAMLRENFGTVLQKAGARANAIHYLLEQAEKSFEIREDKVVARDGLFSDDDPTKSLSPEEWVKKAVKDHDFAFEKSNGDGGTKPPAGGRGSGTPPRVGVKILKSPTPEELGLNADAIAKGEVVIQD